MTTAPSSAALLDALTAWRDARAKPDLRGLPTVNVPMLGKLREFMPDGGAQRALVAAYNTALRLSQPTALLRQAKVDALHQLRERALTDCDAQARKVARQSGWLAGGSGAALGLAGAAGMVADVPALLLLALRALIRIGYCYGEAPSPALVAALFALASADTDEEKRLAWKAALTAEAGSGKATAAISDAAIRDGLERAAEREFAKQALAGSLQKLAVTMVQRLGLKKSSGLLPVLGAAVGGAVNIRFLFLLSESARMAFAARRMIADGRPLQSLLIREPLRVGKAEKVAPRRRQIKVKKKAASEKPSMAGP
ncbi:MAG: EcsC family protein [Pseudomonadota bacterium]